MYARLSQIKEIEAMSDRAAQTSGEQPKRLAAAILAYAKNIDKLQNLGPAVSRMVARHIETGVRPEHYPHVANALLPAIRDVLGEEVATDTVLAAWGEAYRSEEHTSELQSPMSISYAVFFWKKQTSKHSTQQQTLTG